MKGFRGAKQFKNMMLFKKKSTSIARRGDKVVKVPKGSMVTADFRPDRVRQYTGRSGKILYERRG